MARPPTLENAIMEICWDADRWLSVEEVRSKLDHAVSTSTVNKVMSRLLGKGRLVRKREGRAFVYRPTVTRPEYVANLVEEALEAADNRGLVLLNFVRRLSPGERTQLRRGLEEE